MKSKFIILNVILIIILNTFLPTIALASDNNSQSSKTETTVNEPEIVSDAGFLMEVKSGNVLYSKNSSKKLYPASTTKVMTAILTLENCELDEMATVSQNAVDLVPNGYTNAKLVPGEQMKVEDLLYALMLNSANEAANVLGEHVSGTIEEFAKLMNEKAEEIGCKNTHFVNTNGMHDKNHYTTAEDLAKIAVYCMKNEEFRKIVSTVEYKLPTTELYTKDDRIMKNTNMLIHPESKYYMENVIGVKTGYTKEAGNCLISYAVTDNGEELVCVTLKAGNSSATTNQRFADSKDVLEYGLDNFSTREIIKEGKQIEKIQIKNATKKTKYLEIVTKESVSDFINNDIDISEIDAKIDIKDELSAPIKKGEKLGTITYEIDGKEYATDLIAKNEVKRSYILFIVVGILVVIIAVIVIIINFKGNSYKLDDSDDDVDENF